MTATTQTEALNAARANYYRFLRRFYFQEVDTPLWAQLRQMNIPADCPQPRMAEGYEMLRDFLARHDADILDELAADFAKVFLASGEYQGKGAFPYESVYTSRQGLVRQQAWEQVRGIYDAAGLTLTGAPSEIMEDHIATELEYMALLAEQGTAAPAQQLDFLTQHLLNWVPRLCADMKKYARTDFYKAVALLTEGFLAMDAELLEERSQGSTGSFQLTHVQMNAVLAELSKTYRIFAPKRTGKRGPGGQEIVRYGEISAVEEIVYDRPSDFSAKEAYYPVIQTMFYFTRDESRQSELTDERGILVLAHPCDCNAIRRLDNIFLRNGGQPDLFYARLREKVKLGLLECAQSWDNCFCVSMGSNVAEDYSIALRLTEQGCLVQVKDAAFAPCFAGQAEVGFEPQFVRENRRKANLPVIESTQDVKLASSLPFWAEYDETCLSCGGCNTVCPTCSCFDTVDVTYDETSRDGERRRVWSSCMLSTFTQTAGGGRARSTAGANMRFKTLHKVYDYKKRFDAGENMCVGCGRCIARCPREIDFLDTINRFHDELDAARKED